MVITRRRARRRAGIRNLYRRSRLPRFGTRRRRIMRRAMGRRPLRPEIKFIDRIVSPTVVGGFAIATTYVNANTLAVGADNAQRVGQTVNLRKISLKLALQAPRWGISETEFTNFSTNSDYVRAILWTPRVDYGHASTYMATTTLMSHLDYHVITVVKDMLIRLSPRFTGLLSPTLTVTGYTTSTTQADYKIFKMVIPFPRKAKFLPTGLSGAVDLDEDKDVLYLTIVNGFPAPLATGASLQYEFTSRLFYTDA